MFVPARSGFAGIGFLVAPNLVMTHGSLVPNPSETAYVEFADRIAELPDAQYRKAGPSGLRPWRTGRSEIQVRSVQHDEPTGCALLTLDSSVAAPPLRFAKRPLDNLTGRKVYTVGYPIIDGRRIDPAMEKRVFGDLSGVLRVMPGEVVEPKKQSPTPAVLAHNCFTGVGTGGAPVVDLVTGEVIALHYSGFYGPTVQGLKEGHAAPMWALAERPLFATVLSGGKPPSEAPASPREIFVNRLAEIDLFRSILAGRTPKRLLIITGASGMGKTALLFRMRKIAQDSGTVTAHVNCSELLSFEPELNSVRGLLRLVGILTSQISGQTVRLEDPDPDRASRQLVDRVRELASAIQQHANGAVIMLDAVEHLGFRFRDVISPLLSVAKTTLVLAGQADPFGIPQHLRHHLELGPLEAPAIRAWMSDAGLSHRRDAVELIAKASGGNPSLVRSALEVLLRDQRLE